ncbi:MAG: zinc dependent phospholipase C family protein [Thermoflexales bacterium]|nr:zinc dependent phospholipase C family protein [Thermoflexales bacterium]
MPPINTHINFARMSLARVEADYDTVYFVLGSIAPDCFDREDNESFRSYHFAGDNMEPDLDIFLKATHLSWHGCAVERLSFVTGYYSHLWLDKFFRAHAVTSKLLPLAICGLMN